MGSIDALIHYDNDGLPWSYCIEKIWRLAECHGVDVRVDRKSPERELGYFSITVSADEMPPVKRFITSLFKHIGVSDSPIFYVCAKNRYRLPAFSKRLARTPIESTAGMEC